MNKVTVSVQITKSFEITKAERSLILDLAEAKSICDKIWETPQ